MYLPVVQRVASADPLTDAAFSWNLYFVRVTGASKQASHHAGP